MDWHGLFGLSANPVELLVRGSSIYWFLFFVFRFIVRRGVGAIGIADVLLLVLIADAAQNAMAGGYTSITDGIILVSTIIGWNLVLDWAAFRSDKVAALLDPPPILLVHLGRALHRNLRREFISMDELMSKLREHGVEDLKQVKAVHLESSGELSVIRRDGGDAPTAASSKPGIP